MKDRKGGILTWIPFLFMLLLGGIILGVIASISLGLGDLGVQREVEVEEQLVFTVSSGSSMQIANTVLATESGMEEYDERVVYKLSEFIYCHGREEEKNCGEDHIDETEMIEILDYQTEWLFEDEEVLEKPYFVRVTRDGETIMRYTRGDLEIVYSSSEDRYVPQFGEDATVVRVPVSDPAGSSANIEFHIPAGGLRAGATMGGGG